MTNSLLAEVHNKLYSEVRNVAIEAIKDMTQTTSEYFQDLEKMNIHWIQRIALLSFLVGAAGGFTIGLLLGVLVGKWG